MKRICMILSAIILLLGILPAADAAFSDADSVADRHRQAVEYVNERGVVTGFPDGSFRPQASLTRAQAAKILCTATEGAETAEALTHTNTGFSDVPASHWAAKYVAYCAEKGIVAGVGNGRFAPDEPLTAVAFAKMLLVAYGQMNAQTAVGAQWMTNTRLEIRRNGFDQNVDSLRDAPATRENACCLVYNFMRFKEIQDTEPEAYRKTELLFTDGSKYRLLGRALQTEKGVVCDWSADGVEFTADCKGTLFITANPSVKTSTYLKFRVFVDGAPGEQIGFPTAGEATGLAAFNVPPGVHTIRILKDTQISNSEDLLKSITFFCKPDTVKPTQPKKKLLEVIGDSSSAGYGAVVTDTPTTTRNSSSISLSYGYLAAEALDMDWQIVVRGSLGVIKRTGTPEYNYTEMYEYQNRWRDPDTVYSFPRKADVVLLKISGNDGSFPVEEIVAAHKAFVKTIRRYHGEDTPIVFFCFQTRKNTATQEQVLKEIPNSYGVLLKGDISGMGEHPSAEAQARFAEETVRVLRPLVGE